MSDTWYFAYGSNMSRDQKSSRTKRIRRARPACLKEYRLAFNKRGAGGKVFANIMPSSDDVVWGVAYLCNPQAMASLDAYEGVEHGDYRRGRVEVESSDGEMLMAEAYIAGDDFVVEASRPSDGYLDRILRGAREHDLPPEYIRQIEELAGRLSDS